MDLRATKATPALNIAWPFKNMALVANIAAHLREFGSIGTESFNKKQLGLFAEYLVAKDLHARNYRLLRHQLKTPFAEVDLLLQTPKQELLICEVKLMRARAWAHSPLPERQLQRLSRAQEYLAHKYDQPCEVWLAKVSAEWLIEYFIDGLT